MIFSDFKYMTSTIPDTNAYSVYFGCSSVASIDQCKLHQDVRSVHKFLFGQYGEKNIWNVQQSYMKHSERSLIELPLEIFAASVNSCFMFYRANLHFHVKHGWLSEGKERWSSRSIAYDEFIGSTVHINKHCLLSAFAYFDEDASGYITVDPLEEVCWEYNTGWRRQRDIIREVGNENMRM